MIILRRELRPVIYRLSIKIMVHLPLTVKKGRVKSMKKKNKYTYLFKLYPPFITKDQFYRICNISKKTAAHLLDNGLVPCVNSGKKTRKYKIKLEDVIEYLESREKDPGRYAAPSGWYKTYGKPDEKDLVMTPENIRRISAHYLKKLSKYPDVFSVNQLSSLTGYSTTTLLKWINRGAIKHLDMGNRYLVPKEWLLDFLSGPEFMKARIPSKYGEEQIKKIFKSKD